MRGLARLSTILLLGAATIAGPAMGAPKPGEAPAVLQSLLDCRTVTPDAARLACYDKAAAAVQSATTSGDLVSLDRQQRRAARRQAFGFSLPSFSFLDRGEKPGGLSHITATATSVGRNALGLWVVHLDDGSTWEQTESVELGRSPRAGSKVSISKGMLGSFFMTIDGEGAGRARRIG